MHFRSLMDDQIEVWKNEENNTLDYSWMKKIKINNWITKLKSWKVEGWNCFSNIIGGQNWTIRKVEGQNWF